MAFRGHGALKAQWSVVAVKTAPRRVTAADSGQGQEELLQALGVLGLRAPGLGKTLFEAGRDDGDASSVKCVVDCGELGDDVLAVAALLNHAQDAADLADRKSVV